MPATASDRVARNIGSVANFPATERPISECMRTYHVATNIYKPPRVNDGHRSQ